jgi:two-component system, sensor histidine kinase and response regulator
VNDGSCMLSLTRRRTEEIFNGLRRQIFVETDRLFAILMALQWIFGIVIAYMVSPRAWAGSTSGIHIHVWAAIFLGGAISSFPIALAIIRPGQLTTRYCIAIGQMLTSALLIHLTGGRIETHFHVFGSLAFLAFYRDWRLLVPATIVVAADHFLRGVFWPQSVYGVLTASAWRSLEHSGWVVFEDIVLVVSCLRGTRELRRIAERTAEFETSEERYRAVVEQTAEGIFVFDVQHNAILECNAAFARMLGTSPDVVTTLTVGDLMTSGEAALGHAVDDSLGDRLTTVAERSLRRLDGTVIDVECSLSPTIYGHQPAMCAVVRDIRERKRIEANLAKTRDAAIEASLAKSEFLANMSHEIRTPMNGVIGMTELALDTELSEQQRDYLVTVKSSADSLLAILNDILDFSKIESRKLELESIPFAVRDVVGSMLKPLAVKADQKGLELLLDCDPQVPAGIVGDPVRLQQVLTNLIGNAIKFTEHGHVLVEVREDTRCEGSTRLHFKISDTGIGIPAEKHATVFEAFSQADGSTTRRFGGTGLGLTISSNLVHLMGGRIWLESAPGKGSDFHFTAGFATAAVGTADRASEPLLAELPVLIVDDNAVNRRILHTQLTRWHTRPTVVTNGREALDTLSAAAKAGRPFMLVLLDVNMPNLDGFQVAKEIAARPELAGATIMMLSSSGHPWETSRCRELGVSAYLTKPIQASDLHEAICRVLYRPSTARAGTPNKRSAAHAARPMKVLLAEDNIVNQRVAVGLLSRRGHTITVANNGVEALAELERGAFDVVLMDVQMPEMGGLEATAAIRERELVSGGRIRIVAMTAHAMKGDRERCLAAGMDGYLAKPIDPTLLYAALEHQANGVEPEAIAIAPANAPSVLASATPPIDRAALMERLGGDTQLLIDVVRVFLDDCPLRLAAIKAAVDSRNPELIRTTAHALKGAAANLSAQGLFEAAAMLERLGVEGRLEPAGAAWRQLSIEATSVIDMLRKLDADSQTEDMACAS